MRKGGIELFQLCDCHALLWSRVGQYFDTLCTLAINGIFQ